LYKITKKAGKKNAGTVQVVGLSKEAKKASKVSVPATVKIDGVKYQVTSIGAKALKGANAKTIVVGKNVKSIGKEAFFGCKKLKTLVISGKLSTTGKKLFKGCKNTITVKGAAGKVRKKNVKILKKSGYKKIR
jgi:hypothetical protein